MPIFLWSAVVIHDQKPVVVSGRRKMVVQGRTGVSVAISVHSSRSLQTSEIRHEGFDLITSQTQVRHERTRLDGRRIGQPLAEALLPIGLTGVETLGEDGATHQILEDVGMMKMLPNMTVIHTCDYEQTRNATHAVAAHEGPVYFRFGRPKVPIITDVDTPFIIGKARKVMTGSDVTLVTNGHLVWNSILAARQLAAEGISVDLLDMHTIKPLDNAALLESVGRTRCVVSAEEHQRNGGLGESVAACLAAHHPTPQRFVAVEDQFGESGTPAQLLEKYGLGPEAIVRACKEVIGVKQGLTV